MSNKPLNFQSQVGGPVGIPRGLGTITMTPGASYQRIGALKHSNVDPKTGYLIPHNATSGSHLYFTPERKSRFVKLAKELYPNLHAVCEIVGITKLTYKTHYAMDRKFKEDMDELIDRAIDMVEHTMFSMAKKPMNFMDRIAILRSYRGEIYNPKSTVTIKRDLDEREQFERKVSLAKVVDTEVAGASAQVLDAEVIETTAPEPEEPTVTEPVQSPAGEINDTVQVQPVDLSKNGFRDPLASLE